LPRNALNKILVIFKLFKDDLINSNLIIEGGKPVDRLPHYTYWIDPHRGAPIYRLSSDEETQFCSFWKNYAEINAENFAVYRFNLADYEPFSSDRFVNYIESLEYLLVPDSSEGEIRFKFSMRGAILLGKTVGEREGILDLFKAAYDLRSAIVHGNNEKITKLKGKRTWEDVTKPIRAYTRDAIKFFFENGCLDNAEERSKLIQRITIFSR